MTSCKSGAIRNSPGTSTLHAVSSDRNTANSVELGFTRSFVSPENRRREQWHLTHIEAGKSPCGKMRRISLRNCPYCGCSKIYASSSALLWRAISSLFLIRLVRCHVCMRRHYRPIFVATPENPARGTAQEAATVVAITAKETHKRSA